MAEKCRKNAVFIGLFETRTCYNGDVMMHCAANLSRYALYTAEGGVAIIL